MLIFDVLLQGFEGLRGCFDAVVQQGYKMVLVIPPSYICRHDHKYERTARNDNPDEIQEKVVKPKVISLRPAVG